MTRICIGLMGLCAVLANDAVAQDRQILGFGFVTHNDYLQGREDRWRTGGATVSIIHGTGWSGDLPNMPGQLVEVRFRADILSAETLDMPGFPDRYYAGTLAFGAHTHFAVGEYDVTAGADIAAIGEQTGLNSLHSTLHDIFGGSDLDLGTHQVDDAMFLNTTVEVGREMSLGAADIRPFVEASAGVESYLRTGVDLSFGSFGFGGLMAREVATGQRYATLDASIPEGYAFTLGADVAHVFDSYYLPSSDGFELEETRYRLRAGFHADTGRIETFFGASYLGEEFQAQTEGQIVGSMSIRLEF